MGTPYVGEIRMFAGNFAPAGWELCDGRLLPISENEVLFQLIGTTYGGNGEDTFALPDLRGRIPVHMGTGPSGVTYQLGEMAGTESETLSTQQIPSHSHALLADSQPASTAQPVGAVLAESEGDLYADATSLPQVSLAAGALHPAGGSQPHENMQPFLCVNFIIALYGVFPSQT